MKPDLISRIFQVREQYQFQDLALEIFKYQFDNNPVYNSFARQLGIERNSVSTVTGIPFIPVEFFKSHKLISGSHKTGIIFESSGTAGMNVSRHFVADPALYEESLMQSFRMFYGEPSGYFIASMTPSPEERRHSSLAYMMDKLIRKSSYRYSGFYMNNAGELISRINESRSKDLKIILTGLSYALIDLAGEYSPDLSGVVVMETGGMKGRKKEMTREELHEYLKRRFNLAVIHSEYGMTELLSQAYSAGEGIFHCPPWMRVFIRDYQDPLTLIPETGRTGAINIIDLANIYSCSFIATDDLGRLSGDGGFEVLGRIDKSDIRGCNLLVG